MEIGARLARLCAGHAPDQPPDEGCTVPLTINDNETLFGTRGRSGTTGDSAPPALQHGEGGSNGRPGQAAEVSRTGQGFAGDAGDDFVFITLAAEGGSGGVGGNGGWGNFASNSVRSESGPTWDSTFNSYGGNGNGGNGGRGAGGAAGGAILSQLVFDMLGVPGGSDVVALTLQGVGGSGGGGGQGGFGRPSSGVGTTVEQIGVPGNYYTVYTETTGAPGGISGLSGDGGRSARGLVAFDELTFSGGTLSLSLRGLAAGGDGAPGGSSFSHAAGGTVADGHHGGDGSAAGAAQARVANLIVTATGELDIDVTIAAAGGRGGPGGWGSDPVARESFNSILTNGVGTSALNHEYARAGNGGDGGAGGAAVAAFTGAAITGTAQADWVRIDLRATGGEGGTGGRGGRGVDDSIVVTGDPGRVLYTTTVNGTSAGDDGTDGIAGASTVRLTDNIIGLGDGDDQLSLLLLADGSGARTITVARNLLDGGQGIDTLSIGNFFSEGQPDVTFNVFAGTFRVGAVGSNAMAGFEEFVGGRGDDHFIDGAGNQGYRGSFGADRFEFVRGRDGNDTVWGFDRFEDTVVLRGFGAPLNDFADVLAAATQTQAGVRIQTSPTSTVLLAGVQRAELEANDFLF